MKTSNYRWIPAVIWACVVFGLSSIPGRSIPSLGFSAQDKLAHGFVFGTLAILVLWALRGTRFDRRPWFAVALAVVIATAYGVSDEFHQRFVPFRSPDVFDVIADGAGALLGAVVFSLWTRRRSRMSDPLNMLEKNPEIARTSD